MCRENIATWVDSLSLLSSAAVERNFPEEYDGALWAYDGFALWAYDGALWAYGFRVPSGRTMEVKLENGRMNVECRSCVGNSSRRDEGVAVVRR